MSLLQSIAPPSFSLLHFTRQFCSENPNSPIIFLNPQKPRQSPKPYFRLSASSAQPNSEQNRNSKPSPTPRKRGRPAKPKDPPEISTSSELRNGFPTTVPRKPRRGRRSEAVAVEDYVRERLEQVFVSIREQNADVLEGKGEVLKQRVKEVEEEPEEGEKVHVVDEEDPHWPLDADVGWGVRASEYFEKHPIKNVVVDGVEIDWEGEMDEGWVQEITCLEWESFAFHPSPLIVLVFERYNRAADNWKLLKELEKAAKVYWSAKDRLPPRTIKIDMNIETDLAYALKVRECPQLLFLKGNRIVYREKEMRTADELVEGATNEDGKGDSIWDIFSKTKGNITDGSSGDIAVDQYHRYKEDVELIAKLGFGAYRFSISWSRIFPDGFGNKVNEKGIAYYNHLIDYLLKKGIQPYVTLYHWDLPYNLHESEGGWLSEKVVEYFALYAEVCFARFGDRVKHWMTINEPLQTAINGYSIGIFAPGRRDNPYKEPYLAAHYQILAHAAAVDVYRKKFKATQGGEIGLVVDCEWAEAFSDKEQDIVAVERRLDFQLGWFLDPIFYGDYPAVMRERLGDHLPQFTQRDKELLRSATDFIGLNHYTSRLIAHASGTTEGPFYEVQELERMVKWEGGELIGDRAASNWLYIVPWGFRKVLNYIAQKYKNIPIYVTENGMDDEENETATLNEFLNDEKRVKYFKGYIGAVAQAIRDGVDVRGYFAWSLLDNFEWAQGYTKRFGLVYVDYKNGLKRYPKSSAIWFSHFLQDKSDNDFGIST